MRGSQEFSRATLEAAAAPDPSCLRTLSRLIVLCITRVIIFGIDRTEGGNHVNDPIPLSPIQVS